MRRILLLIALVLTVVPVAPAEPASAAPGPLIIAHRGGAGLWPENTTLAFRRAAGMGVDVVEFDVRMTSDAVPVVLHDATLDRTTNCTGLVAERTYAEIAGCDAAFHFTRDGVTFPFRGTGVTIPPLTDALRAARYLGVLANLEIKNVPTEPDYDPKPGRTVRAVAAAITSTGSLGITTVSSFWPPNLDWIELKLPGVRTALLTQGDPSGLSPTSPRFPCVGNVAFSIVRRYEVSQPEYLSADMAPCARVALAAGHQVQVWTVDDPAALAAMVALRVDGIMTNRPDLLLEVLGRR